MILPDAIACIIARRFTFTTTATTTSASSSITLMTTVLITHNHLNVYGYTEKRYDCLLQHSVAVILDAALEMSILSLKMLLLVIVMIKINGRSKKQL